MCLGASFEVTNSVIFSARQKQQGRLVTDQQENSVKQDRSGAESLVETFVEAGVDVCFANPGTSEMHLVTAIGKTDKV